MDWSDCDRGSPLESNDWTKWCTRTQMPERLLIFNVAQHCPKIMLPLERQWSTICPHACRITQWTFALLLWPNLFQHYETNESAAHPHCTTWLVRSHEARRLTVIPDWTGQEDDTYWASTWIGLELDMKSLPLCPVKLKICWLKWIWMGGGIKNIYTYSSSTTTMGLQC